MTNASTMKARNTKAKIRAMTIDSIVSRNPSARGMYAEPPALEVLSDGVAVVVDSENFEEVRPKAAVAANVGAGPDIIIATGEDHLQYPDQLVDLGPHPLDGRRIEARLGEGEAQHLEHVVACPGQGLDPAGQPVVVEIEGDAGREIGELALVLAGIIRAGAFVEQRHREDRQALLVGRVAGGGFPAR